MNLDQKKYSNHHSVKTTLKIKEEEAKTTINQGGLINQMCNFTIARNMATFKVNAGKRKHI